MAANPNARDLFLDALDRAPAERDAFLAAGCGDDTALRQRVEALLRANDDPAAFLSVAQATSDFGDPAACVGALLAGKYKLVEEIGAGGMGSVFLAQQTEPVKRAVAVKVIKAGMDSRAVLLRFEAERQALALMDHPNIARVFDAGATDSGRPFFVMELVKGVPINKFCDDCKLTPRERLELLVPVCQAIQHAHQKGIIHRDIKPSNVLVALYDDKAVPKVIDFGVAKATGPALTEQTLLTGFGAVVGTPEYMSPEQASLNNLDIDTRSDVYSLGVLLYELLTGSTPVDRQSLGQAALLEVLRIVREVEAPRPSARLSNSAALTSVAAQRGTEPARLSRLLRGELDWVVMKALEKDRSRRYESATALASDLQRFLADEVVEARPPSYAYRLSKFVRRHREQTLAACVLLFTLVAGVVGTTQGLLRARKEAEFAWRSAEAEEVARGKAVAAWQELQKADDLLVTGMARALLRPLGAQVQPHQAVTPLNEQESESLWELAAANDRLRLRFVEEALRDPGSTRRLNDRAALAFQAAVGLEQSRRSRVEMLLTERLQSTVAPQQEQVALCLVELGGVDGVVAGRVAVILSQSMTQTTDPHELRALARGLATVALRMEARDALATLTQTVARTTDPATLDSLAAGVAAVAARLTPQESAAVLVLAMKTAEPMVMASLAECLAIQAFRLASPEAGPVCGQAATLLSQAATTSTELASLGHLKRGLTALAPFLGPTWAAAAAVRYPQSMTDTTEPVVLRLRAECLGVLARRLDPGEATRLCGQVAAPISQLLSRTTELNALEVLARAAQAVAPALGPQKARDTARALTQAMTEAPHWYPLQALAESLAAVAPRLDPAGDGSRVCQQAVTVLARAMSRTTNGNALIPLRRGLSALAECLDAREVAAALSLAMTATTEAISLEHLAQCLSGVAPRLSPKSAAETANALVHALTESPRRAALRPLAEALATVTKRLDPKDAAQVCSRAAGILSQAIPRTAEADVVGQLASGLAMVAPQLEPREAVALLGQAMTQTTEAGALQRLGEGLVVVAARLAPEEAAAVCGQAATVFTQAMSARRERTALGHLGRGLAQVAGRLRPKAAAEAAASLSQSIARTTEPNALSELAESLAVVAARLDPNDAASVCGRAAATLTQHMSRTKDQTALYNLARGLAAVAARQHPREAAATLGQAIDRTREPHALPSLAAGLAAVAAHLEAPSAEAVCQRAVATLSQARARTTEATTLSYLNRSLASVATRLDPKAAVDVLTQSMTATTEPFVARELADELFLLAKRLDSASAANTLSQVMARTTGSNALEVLARGVATAAGRLEATDAGPACGRAAAVLLQEMTRAGDANAWRPLADGLTAVLCREDARTARQRMLSGLAAVGSTTPFAEIAVLQPALQPPPPPLPAQTLLELLKLPFCVGEARRRVLEQLSRHYHRPFADQWEFVDHVNQQHRLDLTTPTVRPR